MRKKYPVFDLVSKIGNYMFVFSCLFFLQKYIFGLILPIKKIVLFNKIYLYEVILLISSIYIIKKHIRITTPYKSIESK